MEQEFRPGLEGVVAAETALSSVDGAAGELVIGGYAVEELAGNATFEETLHLLWRGRIPDRDELSRFTGALAAQRELSAATMELLRSAARTETDPMDALRMGVASVSLVLRADGADRERWASTAETEAARLVAAVPTLVAAYHRLRAGLEPIAPRPDLNHAANYLFMLTGEEGHPARVRGLETYLNTVVDHGLNASTFAARVIVSTGTDLVSAITGAVGALKGPLHGGAPGPALDTVFAIGEGERAEPYLRALLERGERLMGFGHRIYKVRDPRAAVLSREAERFYRQAGDMALYELARHVEAVAVRLLGEYKPGRCLQTNVEFYTALLLHGIGLPVELFTPTFAVSRVGGWTAHCLEQLRNNRIFRPQSVYVGPTGLTWGE